jgi:hypothetical protein
MHGSGSQSKRRNAAKPNAVREAVEHLGGVIEASALLRVSNVTVFRWMRLGYVPNLAAALKLARASGFPVERFSKDQDEVATEAGTGS